MHVALRPKNLYLAHHPVLAEHPYEKKMYDKIRRLSFRPNMMNEVDRNREGLSNLPQGRYLLAPPKEPQLIFLSGPSRVCILQCRRMLPKVTQGNLFIVVITHCYSKLI